MPQSAPVATRRDALRVLTGATLALVPALRPQEAGAFRGWCRADPIFRIESQKLHLWVTVRWKSKREAYHLSRGPIQVDLFVPVGVDAQRLDRNAGFGDGFDVAIETDRELLLDDGMVPLRFRVRVPFAEDVPARAWLRRLEEGPVSVGRVRGHTNEWMEFLAR